MRIEARQMFCSNGLIDDFALYARLEEYLQLAETVGKATNSKQPEIMFSESDVLIEIICREAEIKLSTSLQNKTNNYASMDDWKARNILRIRDSHPITLTTVYPSQAAQKCCGSSKNLATRAVRRGFSR